MSTHTLANDELLFAVSDDGRAATLRNRRTGCDCLARPGSGLWELIYHGEADPETPVRAADQPQPRIASGSDWLRVHHDGLTDCAGRRLDLALTWEVTLSGDELTFTVEIENRAAPEVRELWFPLLGGLGSLGTDPDACFLLYPESAGRRIRNPLRQLADRHAQPVRGVKPHFLRDLYPGRASMQWLGLYGARASLYLGSHDRSLQTTATNATLQLGATPADDTLALGWIKYPFVAAGARWRSAPFVVALHAHSWHHDARRYRRFCDGWQTQRAAPRPAWVLDAPAMHDIVLLHQHGRVNFRYDQIPEIAAAAHLADIDVLKLTGWSEGGHDNQYPDFLPSARLGGEAGLRQALAQARAAGLRTVLYFHFAQMSPNSAFYRRHGGFCAMKSPGGNPFIDVFTWPSHGTILHLGERVQLINACPGAAPWQAQVLDCTRRGLHYGADCVFLDQTAGGPGSFLCFDTRHGHPSPAFASGPGKVALSAQARQLVTGAGADAALGAEYITDAILQHYDFTIPFGMGFFPGGQHFGEMYRYTFPEDVIFSQYMSREDWEQLLYSFVMGYRFFLAPRQQCELLSALEPAFVRRLAGLVSLRRRLAPLLLRSRFRDVEPLAAVGDGLCARAFEGADGAGAVTVWNPTPEPLPLRLDWPGRRLRARHAEPAAADSATAPRDALAPGAAAVLEWE